LVKFQIDQAGFSIKWHGSHCSLGLGKHLFWKFFKAAKFWYRFLVLYKFSVDGYRLLDSRIMYVHTKDLSDRHGGSCIPQYLLKDDHNVSPRIGLGVFVLKNPAANALQWCSVAAKAAGHCKSSGSSKLLQKQRVANRYKNSGSRASR
jgi:hypothetical protein